MANPTNPPTGTTVNGKIERRAGGFWIGCYRLLPADPKLYFSEWEGKWVFASGVIQDGTLYVGDIRTDVPPRH